MNDGYHLVVYDDAAAFVAVAEPYLLEHEVEHCLLLGLLPTLLAGFAADAYLAVVHTAGGAPALVALQTPPHRMILSRVAAGHDLDEVLAQLLAAAPRAMGVIGAVDPAAAYARAWSAAHAITARRTQAERVYQCTAVVPPKAVPGSMLRAATHDRELLVAWRLAFMVEASPTDPRLSLEGASAAVDRDMVAADGGLWLWWDAGRAVSLAGVRGPTRNGIRIGPVYTPPEQRGRGYASALTAALTQHLLASGRAHVTLFTDLANPTSNGIYQAIGYRAVADQDVYDFG